MGSEFSQDRYDSVAAQVYDESSRRPCLLPDIAIDESLLRFSGLNSSSELQAYSNELDPFDSVPNAAGLGALVISMIMEICIKLGTQTNDDSYNMLRRVFGEEKASAVRDTIENYVKRHHMFMNDDQPLQEELRRLERQLSDHLTVLKNSLLLDGQMSTRGFKIWVNGASFHVQMLIHEARLINKTVQSSSPYVNTVSVAIDFYLRDLNALLQKYKTYKTSITSAYTEGPYGYGGNIRCYVENVSELNCRFSPNSLDICGFWGGKQSKYIEAYINHIFTNYEAITGLKTHFLNAKNNLPTLINQHEDFIVPSAA
ncbi:hypothetical protein Q5P01_001061 [Channa striata]|uniref:Uncharacterized protein n=1 Tax=Channa striata TaxID=64152 RepID=A0AA88T4W9_CHASR|nr:hypothetical protein Q5P01_001061 [Channa striata]